MSTSPPPVTSYETVHDYSLLERRRESEAVFLLPRWLKVALIVSAGAAVLAVVVTLYALSYTLDRLGPKLVPGVYTNSTVVVDANGRVVAIAQGHRPETAVTPPLRPQGRVSESSQEGSFENQGTLARSPTVSQTGSVPSSSGGTSPQNPEPPGAVPEEPPRIVENFVKFQSVKFKGGVVDTGWRYADSSAFEPEAQWCYFRSLSAQPRGLGPTIDLQDEADPQAIAAVGLSYGEYIEAREKCQWFNKARPTSKPSPGKTY